MYLDPFHGWSKPRQTVPVHYPSRQIIRKLWYSISGSIGYHLSSTDLNKVIAAAKRIEPQQCQMYVVAVVAKLDRKGLLPAGRTSLLKDKVQMSKQSSDFRRAHPVAKPALAYTQSNRDAFYR